MTEVARAEDSGLRLHGSLGAGLVVSTDQLGVLDYDGIVGRVAASVGHALGELLIVEGQGAASVFGSHREDGSLFEVGGGVRIDWRTPLALHVSPATHLHLASTGGQVRPTIDVSLGLLFEVTRALTFGPIVQYGQVFQPDGDRFSTDARYFTFGIGVGYRPVSGSPARSPADKRTLLAIRRIDDDVPLSPPEPPPPPPEPLTEELVTLIDEASDNTCRSAIDVLPPILFEHDSVEVIPCGEAALFRALDAVRDHEGLVIVEGHADGTGEDAYNVDLARRRARRVHDWLVQQGIDATRLRVESHGERRHLTEEHDGSRRQLNRRVIIRLEDPP